MSNPMPPSGVPTPPPVPQPVAPPPAPPAMRPMAVPMPQPIENLPTDPAIVAPTIWQHPFVVNVLPFLTSLVLHVGLIALGFVTISAAPKLMAVVKEQIIIPDADIGPDTGPEGGVLNPGPGNDANTDSFQSRVNVQNAQGWAERESRNPSEQLMGGGGEQTNSGGQLIGATGGSGPRAGGVGEGLGSGAGDGGGPLAPFGLTAGGDGFGPRATFIGVRGNAKKIAYVCDASGSMMSKFEDLRNEIRISVEKLKLIQSFNIVFFQQDSAMALSTGDLLVATAPNKRKAFEFLDRTTPQQQTDPIPALEIAFKQKPELIYLLTDGEFADNEKVINWIKTANRDKKVKINTFAFLEHGSEYEKVLQKIADENGGQFRYIGASDLSR